MRTITFTLISLLAAMPLLANSKAISIPFTTTPDGLVIVPATVAGTIPIHVIFDTGAGLDVFAPSLIEKLRGKPTGQFTAFRMTSERLDIPLFIIPQLSIGPVVKKDAVVGSWDVLDKFHLDGVISLNDFRQQPLTFDFIHKVLIFETPRTLARRHATGKSSPLQFDDDRGTALDIFAQFLLANQRAQCEVDTGSPSATVSTRFMASLGVEKGGKEVERHEGHSITGAVEISYRTSLPEIALAAAPQVTLARPHVSFSDIIYDCVLGIDFWSGRALTIDIAHRQLIVSNPPPSR